VSGTDPGARFLVRDSRRALHDLDRFVVVPVGKQVCQSVFPRWMIPRRGACWSNAATLSLHGPVERVMTRSLAWLAKSLPLELKDAVVHRLGRLDGADRFLEVDVEGPELERLEQRRTSTGRRASR
jgi:hypothetical protein